MSRAKSVQPLAWSGFIALAVAMGIGRFAFTPLFPLMQQELGLGLAQGGWLAGANYLGYLAGALTAAFLPWSAPTVLLAGLLLISGTTALMGWTETWSSWIAWRSIAGIASAWVLVAAATLYLARLGGTGEPGKAGMVFSGVGGGIALAGFVCMVGDLRGLSVMNTWYALAAIAVLGAVFSRPLWQRGGAATVHPTEPLPRGEGGFRHWRLIVCYGFVGFGYIVPATFLPAQARMLLENSAVFGLAWPLFGLAAAGSTLACGTLLKRFSGRALWIAAQLLMAAGVILPAVAPCLAGIVAAALGVGGTFMVITMLVMRQAQTSAGPLARSLMASLTVSFATGQLAGPVFFSLMHEHLDGTLADSLYAAAAVLLTGCLLLLKPFPVHAAGRTPNPPDQSAR